MKRRAAAVLVGYWSQLTKQVRQRTATKPPECDEAASASKLHGPT